MATASKVRSISPGFTAVAQAAPPREEARAGSGVLVIALRMNAVTLALTGVVYPLFMTGLGQALSRHRANGSMVTDEKGTVVGSELIAQPFTRAAYLQPRPSAAGNGYDATSSGGSNLGPTSKKL